MRDEHPPEDASSSIVARLPASWSTRPPRRRQVLRFFRSAIVRRDLPSDQATRLAERLTDLLGASRLTRRQFLTQAAVSGLAIVIEGRHLLARAQSPFPVPEGSLVGAVDAPTLTADLLRPQDMLALHFEFFNLDLVGGNLVRQVADEEAFVVAHLAHGQKLSAAGDPISDHAPQHVAEEAFEESDDLPPPPDPDPPGTVEAALAGASRLAFRVPVGVSIPFTPSALLSWAGLQQSVVPAALPPGADPLVPPLIREPLNTETNIEAPWHLVLSPHSGAGWAHALGPVTRDGRTELWHTRLAVNESGSINEGNSAQRTMRAIWTRRRFVPGDDSGSPGPGFTTSLSANNRWQIVRLTSDFGIDGFVPTPVQVDRFMLTALGAWIDVRGNWPTVASLPAEEGLSVVGWRHIATMSRDQYVRIVELGYLFPFGHPAVVVTITERKFQSVPAGDLAGKPAAYLRRRCFVIVRQPLVSYPGQAPEPDSGRHMPFRSVRCTTLITPNLDDPDLCESAEPFWLEVGGDDFLFHLVGEDADGQRTEFTAPLAFVKKTVAPGALADFIDDYNALDVEDPLRKRSLGGRKVAMADNQGQADRKPGDTAVEISTMTFGAMEPDGAVAADQAPFFPTWAEAAVRLDAVEQVKGGTLQQVKIEPTAGFLEHGFAGSNPGQVFAQLKDAVPLGFAADKSGGVITPDMSIGGLSRTLGPFGGAVDPLPSGFNPEDFFADAKVLGGLLLHKIIRAVPFDDLGRIPKTTTRTIYPNGDTNRLPQAIETRLNFQPDLKPDPAGIFDPDGASMTVDATFLTPLDPPGEPSFDILGDLRNFRVTMLGTEAKFLVLQFNRLTFTASKNKKAHVDVDINGVEFAGALSFVNTLKDYLKSSGTGPNIEISLNPPGVSAGWTLAIPTVGVGVITVQNISLSAALNIPFTGGAARVRFALSSRESPFLITVYGLGGGGFFGIAIGMDGVEVVEASLEFGASVALDLGVASGEIHIMGGIYYKMQVVDPPAVDPDPTDLLELTAYIRMGGSMDVLGLITASVEFYLAMRYEAPPTDELWGQARLTIEVEVLFFSTSVSLSVERRLAGGGGTHGISKGLLIDGTSRPKLGSTRNFADLVAQPDWNEYADAFARMN